MIQERRAPELEPLHRVARIRRFVAEGGRRVALGAIALVALVALSACRASRSQTVYVVNGFAAPLSVTLGPKAATVPPAGRVALEVPVGTQHGRAATQKGEAIDELDLQVRARSGFVAWNIAGAAPVYRQQGGANQELFCGQKELSLGEVDDVFTEPPETATAPRVRVGMGPQGPDACRTRLLAEARYPEVARIAEVEARLSGWAPEPTEVALFAANRVSPSEMMRVAAAARDAKPDDMEANRNYQWAAVHAGRGEELVRDYRARAEAHPDSVDAQYLYARLLRGAEARDATEKLVARFPDDPNVLRFAVHARWIGGRFDGAVESFGKLNKIDPDKAGEVVEAEALSLVALGRPADALASIQEKFATFAEEDDQGDTAVLYAQIASGAGLPKPDALIAKLESGEAPEQAVLRLRAGLEAKSAADTVVARLARAVRSDPRATLAEAAKAEVKDVEAALGRSAWALAYGEALRAGARDAAKALEQFPLLEPLDREVFERFVRGQPVSAEDMDVEPDVRAAACFIRSRNAALPEAERKALVQRAQREDVVHGPITQAIRSWKP